MIKGALDIVVSSKEKTLVKFGASWCGPCKVADKILDKVVDAGYTRVLKVDVEEDTKMGSKYQVRTLPTFFIFQDGKELERFTGRQTVNGLIDKLK